MQNRAWSWAMFNSGRSELDRKWILGSRIIKDPWFWRSGDCDVIEQTHSCRALHAWKSCVFLLFPIIYKLSSQFGSKVSFLCPLFPLLGVQFYLHEQDWALWTLCWFCLFANGCMYACITIACIPRVPNEPRNWGNGNLNGK